MKLTLATLNGDQSTSEKTFEDSIIKIGRNHPETDCQLLFDGEDWPMVSRHHAEIFLLGGRWFLVDTKSAFGTFVNGKKITEPTEIREEMRLQFGDEGPTLLVHRIHSTSEIKNMPAESSPTEEDFPSTAPPPTDPEDPAFIQLIDEPTGPLQRYQLTKDVIILGRDRDVDIKLETSSTIISRKHAEIRKQGFRYFLVDCKSFNGTLLNDQRIIAEQLTELSDGDCIRLGTKGPIFRFHNPVHPTSKEEKKTEEEKDNENSPLRVEIPREQLHSVGELLPYEPKSELHEGNEQSLDANEPAFASAETALLETDRRLALFYELPLQFGAETRLESLLQLIVERVIDVILGAQRGALLFKDRATGVLTLQAHWPKGRPAVSMTKARQAMAQQKAFIWPSDVQVAEAGSDVVESFPSSVAEYHIESAMYAPLLWKGEVLGVVCVDNCESSGAFQSDDLRLLQAVAHHAAMAIAQSYALADLLQHTELTNRLFSSRFPPRVRQKLMQEATAGMLLIGARQSDITILISDIRGFTELTARLGPRRMSDLLNEYFPPLIEAIFLHEGTIERFVGDAIFAVFGSPESDDKQHEHAVRAALRMQGVMNEVSGLRAKRGAEICGLGIGIDHGKALHGFIGNAERMEFTVIGDAANRASRYCDGAQAGEVLISPEVYQWVYQIVEAETRDIQTKHEGLFSAYNIKGIKGR
jgi:adenylate cyclase